MGNHAIGTRLAAAAVIVGALMTPVVATAQSWRDIESRHRQQTKNNWRNLSIGAGAVGLYGLLKHDNTLTFAGAAGALYSLDRYERDRKSQSKTDHARAAYFSKPYFYRNGKRYTRHVVNKNGHRYYQFRRG